MRVSSVPQRCSFISAKSTRGLSSSTNTRAPTRSHIPRRGEDRSGGKSAGPPRRAAEVQSRTAVDAQGTVLCRALNKPRAAKCGDAPIPHLCGVQVSAFQYSLILIPSTLIRPLHVTELLTFACLDIIPRHVLGRLTQVSLVTDTGICKLFCCSIKTENYYQNPIILDSMYTLLHTLTFFPSGLATANHLSASHTLPSAPSPLTPTTFTSSVATFRNLCALLLDFL